MSEAARPGVNRFANRLERIGPAAYGDARANSTTADVARRRFPAYLARFRPSPGSFSMPAITMRILLALLMSLAAVAARPGRAAETGKLELRDGDRVLWIGGTLIEREQIYGYWETLLTASYPERQIRFRNLGWSGDTVWAESRGMFDPPAEGYKRMLAMAGDFKPTVIVLAYGANEAFGGPDNLDRFIKQYRTLVNDLKPTGARFAFLLPTDMEPAAAVDPKLARMFNEWRQLYREAIRKLAADLQSPIIDLSRPSAVESGIEGRTLTTDGLHGTALGYWATAHRLRDQIKVSQPDIVLPLPANPHPPEPSAASADRLEQMRLAIIAKNELFFHRWRPQNFTYLFGFRKHEQGNNAVEIPQFDPLIEKQEDVIASLRKG
jgi:lysophospholipase L1-like esterase